MVQRQRATYKRRAAVPTAEKIIAVKEYLGGVSGMETARRHGVTPTSVYTWAREYREGRLKLSEAELHEQQAAPAQPPLSTITVKAEPVVLPAPPTSTPLQVVAKDVLIARLESENAWLRNTLELMITALSYKP